MRGTAGQAESEETQPIRKMKKIYKYAFEISGTYPIDMPVGAEILSVQFQDSTPTLWAMVDPDKPLETRHLAIYGNNILHAGDSVDECLD